MSNPDRQSELDQSRAALRSGRLDEVRQRCGQLLAHDADDPDALNLLGAAALHQGMLDEAERCFDHASKARPREPGILVNLAKVRMQRGSITEAISTFNRAIALNPTMDLALAGKAEALNYLGETQQALATLQPAIHARSEGPETALAYATLLQQTGEHQPVIELVRRHLQDPATRGFTRYRLGLLLGKSLESTGQFAEAFHAAAQANAASGSTVAFDPAAYQAGADRLITFLSALRLPGLPHAAASDTRLPIFIAGMARSGTTLIEQIIQSHPQARGGGEVIFLDQVAAAINQQPGGYPLSLAVTPVDRLTTWSNWYLDGLRALAPDATRIVDKNLRNVEHVGLISLLFPEARVIHCRRDPMDTCLSCFFSPLSPVKHPYSINLNHLGLYYRQQQRLMDHWHTAATVPILQVRYEDLVANQEAVTRSIISFCGLEWHDQCLLPHQSKRVVKTLSFDQVRRPVYDTSLGRHQHYEPFLTPLREGLAGRVMNSS